MPSPSHPDRLFHLKGTMESCYPGYCGSFVACVRGLTARSVKKAFEKVIYDAYPSVGIEAPLVKPIIRYDEVTEVGERAVCWAVVKRPLRRV